MGVPTLRLVAAALMLGSGLSLANVAAAADARKIADSLVALINAGGEATASYTDASASGNDVAITGFAVKDDDSSGEISQILITNPVERTPGGFTADRITFGNGKIVTDDSTVGWATAEIDGATVPDRSEVSSSPDFLPFSRIAFDGVTVSGNEMPQPVHIGKFEMTLTADAGNQPSAGTVSLTGLEIPLSLIDEEQRPLIQSLGYDNGFKINFVAAGGYAHASDTLNMSSISLDVENVGKVEFAGVLSGVPLGKLQSESGMQEVLATAKVESIRIRLANAGIVEKLLDMQAGQMGTTRDDLVTQLTAAMPMMLNVIGNPGFQEKVASAVSTFLKDPKSITISASPAEPVPVMQIIGVGQSEPQTLPDVLSIGITAND